ncbi:MAG: hypothetical protein ACOH2E_07570 [Candidatus Paracaedibacter sp.]
MKIFLKKVWVLLVAQVFVGSLEAQAAETFLYLFYDGSRAGEKNEVHGIAHALKEHLHKDTVQKEFDLKDKEAFLADIKENLLKENSKNKGIILAAEVASINILRQLKPQNNIVIAHSSHQFTKDHATLKDVADIVALPQSVVTDEISKIFEGPQTTLIQTAGVAHNLSAKNIEEAFQKNKDSIPSAPAYVGIILGGDAETPDKKLLYYTSEEAVQVASYIAPFVKGKKAHLLILNGPRTGKHDQKTGEVIKESHRDGSIDPITAAFKEGLHQQGLSEDKNFTIFDFQFGKTSMYPVVLGALRHTNSPIFVAGESTSMVSEAADCLPKGFVTAFTNNAMNENHRKHCFSEKEAGRINILENTKGNWQLLKAKETTDTKEAVPLLKLLLKPLRSVLRRRCLNTLIVRLFVYINQFGACFTLINPLKNKISRIT